MKLKQLVSVFAILETSIFFVPNIYAQNLQEI